MAANSSILAWRIPWTEEPGGLQSMGWQRVRHDQTTCTAQHLWIFFPAERGPAPPQRTFASLSCRGSCPPSKAKFKCASGNPSLQPFTMTGYKPVDIAVVPGTPASVTGQNSPSPKAPWTAPSPHPSAKAWGSKEAQLPKRPIQFLPHKITKMC